MTSRLEQLKYMWAKDKGFTVFNASELIELLIKENDELYKQLEELSN